MNAPRPEVLNEWVTLYEGCCLDVLPTLAAGSINGVVTDPPYSEQTHRGVRSNRNADTRRSGAHLPFGAADAEFITTALGLCRPSRWAVTFLDWRHATTLAESPPAGLEFVRLGAWVKPNPMPQLTGDRPGVGWEAVAILHAAGQKKRWNGGVGPATWVCGTVRWGYFGPSLHPTEKPVPLLRTIVSQFTDAGDTILDPFAGSGTTAIAAMLTGRKCVLVEKDPRYCDVIRRRVERASGDGPGTLFAATDAAGPSLFREGY